MEDSKWLRLMTIGLVLAALAVGYFLFVGRFSSDITKTGSKVSQATPSASSSASPSTTVGTPKPSVLGQNTQAGSTSSPSPTPTSAFSRIVSRNQGNGSAVTTLPRTGFPAGLAAILAISTMISGWGLRRFPH